MGCSSRRLGAAALLWLALPGCWTGRLFEAGRVRESVLEYRSAALEGDRLRVEYTAELDGLFSSRREPRAALLPLAALRAQPPLPVDAFPVERVTPGSPASASPAPATRVPQPSRDDPELLRLEPGPPSGFRLCRAAGGPCSARFYSAALYRDRTAWWVYPLLPLSVALDAALFPLQVVSVGPFFVLGD